MTSLVTTLTRTNLKPLVCPPSTTFSPSRLSLPTILSIRPLYFYFHRWLILIIPLFFRGVHLSTPLLVSHWIGTSKIHSAASSEVDREEENTFRRKKSTAEPRVRHVSINSLPRGSWWVLLLAVTDAMVGWWVGGVGDRCRLVCRHHCKLRMYVETYVDCAVSNLQRIERMAGRNLDLRERLSSFTIPGRKS